MLPFHVLCVYNLIVLHVTISNYLGGFCPSSGGFCPGGLLSGGFCPVGILSRGVFVRSPNLIVGLQSFIIKLFPNQICFSLVPNIKLIAEDCIVKFSSK